MSRSARTLLIVALATACSDSAGTGISDPVAIRIVSGNLQSGVVGGELQNAIVVRVDDADGNPVANQTLEFRVTAGGGSVLNGSSVTNASGLAENRWTLGTTAADTHKVEVRGSSLTTGQPLPPALFGALPLADLPSAVQKQGGDMQVGDAGTTLGDSLQVRVTDRYQNPAPGVVVTWLVTSGGGSVSGDTTVTDATGAAAVEWWLGTRVDTTHQVDAASEGLGSVTFTSTARLPSTSTFGLVSGDNQVGTVNQNLGSPLVVAMDLPSGTPALGVAVTWTIVGGGGAVDPVSAKTVTNGAASTTWTLGTGSGVQEVRASVSGFAPVAFTADAQADVPARILEYAGDNQFAANGSEVAIPPSVVLTDAFDNPVPGVVVSFSVTGGGGSITGPVDTTDSEGIASVGGWTLGPDLNTLSAGAAGAGISGNPITFTATGVTSAFDIEIRYSDSSLAPTATQQAAFESAAARWESLVVGDLSDVSLNLSRGTCAGVWYPNLTNDLVDDLVIYVSLDDIDGAFGILGQAGPCFVRTSNTLPVMGGMRFDVADLAMLVNNGELELVILHEMGHVLGFGTLWNTFGLLQNRSDVSPAPIVDTYFSGASALTAFNSIGGNAYTAGNKVPVENDNSRYGLGSLNSHWRESVFATELMTPSLNSGVPNQLSVVSVASLEDIGYQVAFTAIDVFTWPAVQAAMGPMRRIFLEDDVWQGPIYTVDATGRVVGVVRQQ